MRLVLALGPSMASDSNLPSLTSQMLELQACATMPGKF